jgi:hypothetical protein
MDIIGFICVSLVSSTIQLHDSLGSRHACACSGAGFCSKNGDCAEECTTEEQRSVVRCLGGREGLNAKDINRGIFTLCGEKCLSLKAVHNWVERSGKCFADNEEVETEARKWLRTTVNKILCSGFRRTGKTMGQVYQ